MAQRLWRSFDHQQDAPCAIPVSEAQEAMVERQDFPSRLPSPGPQTTSLLSPLGTPGLSPLGGFGLPAATQSIPSPKDRDHCTSTR